MRAWADEVPEGWLEAIHGGPRGTDVPELDFSVNVNPFAPVPGVAEVLSSLPVRRYPDPLALGPRKAGARLWAVGMDHIRFGAGANDLLHRVALAWLRPGETGVVAEPAFAEYGRAIRVARGRLVPIAPRNEEGALDLRSLLEVARREEARLAYLALPNTPTGEAVSREVVDQVRRELPEACLLVLDESFRAFQEGTVAAPPLLGIRPGVVTVRSVTKDCGLAGLRAGFALGPAAVMVALDRVQVPWSASVAAQEATRLSLEEEGVSYLDETLGRIRRETQAMGRAFREMGLSPRPTAANFHCLRPGRAAAFADALDVRGIRVRRCASFGMPEHVRVGVRSPEDNRLLLTTLEDLSWR